MFSLMPLYIFEIMHTYHYMYFDKDGYTVLNWEIEYFACKVGNKFWTYILTCWWMLYNPGQTEAVSNESPFLALVPWLAYSDKMNMPQL